MHKKIIFSLLLPFTIPIETKISISDLSGKVSSFFKKEEDISYHEFTKIERLEITCIHGSISAGTWELPDVLIEIRKKGSTEFIKKLQLQPTQHDGILQVITNLEQGSPKGDLHIHILTPTDLPMKIITNQGNITIHNNNGPLDLQTESGKITIQGGFNTVLAKTISGSISVHRNDLNPDQTLNLYSESGTLTLAIYPELRAELEAHSTHGKIRSEIFVTLKPQTILLNEHNVNNLKRNVEGWIGQACPADNSPSILLSTESGIIQIVDYKTYKNPKSSYQHQ